VEQHEIRDAAYYKWLRIGSPCLNEEEQQKLWLEAEQDLLRQRGTPYRILAKIDDVEVRKYYPQKRLIVVAGREYYLYFPYMIFGGRISPTNGSYLYVGFSKENDKTIYFPSLPNMCSQTYGICLGRGGGHFQQSVGTSLDKLIETFWITEFDPWDYGWEIGYRSLRQNFNGRLNFWKNLKLPEVLDRISYMPRDFNFFLDTISVHHDDMTMRKLISDYTGCDGLAKTEESEEQGEDDNLAVKFARN